MADVKEVIVLLNSLCKDPSVSKNVRTILETIKNELDGCDSDIRVKIDSALQKVEDISLDPNLSTYVRAQIWSLSSMLESVNHSD